MDLTQKQIDLLIGTLLGDGNLQTFTNGQSWRYRAIHTAKHKDYLEHKFQILRPLCGTNTLPHEAEIEDNRTGKTYRRCNFNTLVQDCLKPYADMFYTYDATNKTWVKDVPTNITDILNGRSLAYLHMDDGSLKQLGTSNAMRISTENFSHEGVRNLQNALQINFNIQTRTHLKRLSGGRQGLIVYIPEKSSTDYCELIRPYLVNCMKYKVSDGRRGHL